MPGAVVFKRQKHKPPYWDTEGEKSNLHVSFFSLTEEELCVALTRAIRPCVAYSTKGFSGDTEVTQQGGLTVGLAFMQILSAHCVIK